MIMTTKNKEDLIKKFKQKVIGKLFGQSYSSSDSEDKNDADTFCVIDGSCLTECAQEKRDKDKSAVYSLKTSSPENEMVQGTSKVKESPARLSDDEWSDADQVGKRRKRRRAHRFSADKKTSQQHKTSSSSPSQGQIDDSFPAGSSSLTKNQKRKLKKKRRVKKQRAEIGPALGFTYNSSMSNSTCDSERLSLAYDDITDKAKAVYEFLEGIWDLYSMTTEDSATTSQDGEHLKHLNEKFTLSLRHNREEVTLIHSAMSILILRGQERAMKAIEEFRDKSSLMPEIKDFTIKLLNHWTTEIMNS